jgi:hypothetical protein
MESYPYLLLVERHGQWLSAALALGFLGLGLCLTMAASPNWLGAALVLLGSLAIWGFMRLLTDVARLLSETLIPRP